MPSPSRQVDALVHELLDSSAHAQKLFSERSRHDLLRRPAEKSWSPAECLEHLNLSNRAYVPLLESCLADLRSRKIPALKSFHINWNAALLRFWLEPPSRLRLPTAPPFQPVPVADPGVSFNEFCSLNLKLIDLLESSRGFALDKAVLASPFAKNMKYNAYSAFTVIAAHNRRHLWQADRALIRKA